MREKTKRTERTATATKTTKAPTPAPAPARRTPKWSSAEREAARARMQVYWAERAKSSKELAKANPQPQPRANEPRTIEPRADPAARARNDLNRAEGILNGAVSFGDLVTACECLLDAARTTLDLVIAERDGREQAARVSRTARNGRTGLAR